MVTETVSRREDRPRISARGVGLLEGLMAVASPHLSDAELSAIADQSDEVRNMLGNIAETADGVASLIADDVSSGALRGTDDASRLLWLFAGQVRHADALLSVAASADLELRRREAVGTAAQ